MKFSIITPSLNQGRFVRDCIESVRAQTGVEWEHIIIDAGSNDETISILKEYPHLQWISEPDKGMSDGINKGFLKATGQWLMWLNADDYLLPGALAQVARFAGKNRDAEIIYGDCVFVDESKKIIRRKREHEFDFSILLFCGCYIPSTSTFLRREIIAAGELIDLNYRVCMDLEYYLRLGQAGRHFAYLPDVLAVFRWHESNTSKVLNQQLVKEWRQLQRQYLQLRKKQRWLGHELLLRVLREIFRAKRIWKRFLAHGRPF
ncbi:MAG: glycosyltransferase family 2 protein [Verrucomicrobiota bacterium]